MDERSAYDLLRNASAAGAVEFALLWAILGAAVYCSYTDIRSRTIPNWCTYGLLFLGGCGQAWASTSGHTTPATAVATVIAGLVVGVAFYVDGMWAPGDAKLYWALVVAVPPWLLRTNSVASLDGPVAAIAVIAFTAYLGVLIWRLCLGDGPGARSKRQGGDGQKTQGLGTRRGGRLLATGTRHGIVDATQSTISAWADRFPQTMEVHHV